MLALRAKPRIPGSSIVRKCALLCLVSMVVGTCGAATQASEAGYPFLIPPSEILERVANLSVAQTPAIGPDEQRTLEAAWNARNASAQEQHSLAYSQLTLEALLAASGVNTAEARARYVERLQKIVLAAHRARDPRLHAGDSLMRHLHATVMTAGYDINSTTLSETLDTGKFNCVSSTALYYVVGRALGLEMRIISIPGAYLAGHACLDLVEGDRVYELEPTGPDGFDWGTKMKQPGVVSLSFTPDRKSGHEVDGLGLAAVIYSNRCVDATRAKNANRALAISLAARALMCDETNKAVANNLVANFVNWGGELNRYDTSFEVLDLGLQATGDWRLKNFYAAAMGEWIDSLLGKSKDREAQIAIGMAQKALPDKSDFRNAGPWIRYAQSRYDKAGRDAALAIVVRGLAAAPEAEQAALHKHRVEIFRRWSQDLLDKKDYSGSLRVLAQAQQLEPKSSDLRSGVAYHGQKTLESLDAEGSNPPAAIAHFELMVAQFPHMDDVHSVGMTHASRSVKALCRRHDYTKALIAADEYAPLAKTPEQKAELIARVWNDWAETFADKRDWQAALDKYLEGLKSVPNQSMLVSGVRRCIDKLADPAITAKQWDDAIAIYDRGLIDLPGDSHLSNNRSYCLERKNRGK